jgi:hypothetical protein
MVPSRPLLGLFLLLSGIVSAQTGPATPGAGPRSAALLPSFSLAVARVDNISRTSEVATRRDATTYEGVLAVVRSQQLNRAWSLTTGADVTSFLEPEFDRNEFTSVAGRLAVQRKAGLGPLAPVLRFETALLYHGARFRSHQGVGVETGVHVSKRLTSAVRVAASLQWRELFARTETFDTHQRALAVEGTWDVAERWSLAGAVRYAEGRFLTHASPANWSRALAGGLGPDVARVYASIPSEVTGLYGPNWITYRPRAHATTGSVSLLFALNDHASAELQGSATALVNEADVRYPTQSLALRLGYRF